MADKIKASKQAYDRRHPTVRISRDIVGRLDQACEILRVDRKALIEEALTRVLKLRSAELRSWWLNEQHLVDEILAEDTRAEEQMNEVRGK